MAGLFHILSVGSEALQVSRQGVDTTGHNIANAQVEGYSRQRVNVKHRDPLAYGNYQIGNGAMITGITRSHDKFIEAQLNKANQESGQAATLHDGWKSIELVFSPELTATIPDEISNFFGSLEDLSSAPDDVVVRTSVVESAKNLAISFRRVDADLKAHKSGFNDKIKIAVSDISSRLKEIADLNLKIQVSEAGNPESASDLRDQRDKLVREVSSQMNIQYYEDRDGMLFIRGPGELTLVDGVHAASLETVYNPDMGESCDIVVKDWESHRPRSITKKIENGSLKALTELRDQDVDGLIKKNNLMAYEFMEKFNSIHREGFGIRNFGDLTGRNFFRAPENIETAAEMMALDDTIIENVDAISAASTPLASGDNVILNNLIRLKDEKIIDQKSMDLNEFYASYAGGMGLKVTRAGHFEEVSKLIAEDLTRRRESVAGVSLDEEATNMLKWQANFTASSKVITTCDEMIETILGLKR